MSGLEDAMRECCAVLEETDACMHPEGQTGYSVKVAIRFEPGDASTRDRWVAIPSWTDIGSGREHVDRALNGSGESAVAALESLISEALLVARKSLVAAEQDRDKAARRVERFEKVLRRYPR